jgi:hypothetical protein
MFENNSVRQIVSDVSLSQCQQRRVVSPARLGAPRGNIGRAALAQVRDTIAAILDVS